MSNHRHSAVCASHPDVMMDDNHIDLIYSLLICHKPRKVLEIGIGSGAVTVKILDAFACNGLAPDLLCVDNFGDWSGIKPEGFEKLRSRITLLEANERDFVLFCKNKFDFIVSDADHNHTNEWVEQTLGLLEDGGILIYHDVTNPNFPNLASIIEYVRSRGISHMLFNRSSLQSEQCHRGLLIIQK